jgi:large subunit ribosomal protein L25
MKTSFELNAEFRDAQGKGASRRLRRENKVPAILYGGHREPRALALDQNKLMQALDNERFYSTIINIKVGELNQAVVLKDVQRHPAKNVVLHLDLQRVLEDEKIRMMIPIHFRGEGVAPGVKKGGQVSHLRNEIEVSCLPKDLPEYLDADLSELDMNQMLYLADFELPEGVEIPELSHGRNAPVASIHHARAEEVEAAPVAEAAAAPSVAAAAPAAAEPAAEAKGAKDAKK